MKENYIEQAQVLLKQYKMLSKALNFINDTVDKRDIAGEMDKLELQILELTNYSYEKSVNKILDEKPTFLKEERLKLQRLVDIISSRIDYVSMALKRHKLSTGNDLVRVSVLEEDNFDKYKNGIRIIDKYRENLKNKSDLISDIKTLEIKIAQAQDRIDSNKKNNVNLEKKMISILDKAFASYDCNDLIDRRNDIEIAYSELQKSLSKAHENVRIAKLGNNSDIIKECDNMLSSITLEYEKYKEKKYLIELFDIYGEDVLDYDSLMLKREKINDILKNISGSSLYGDVIDEIRKQYNVIRLEQQDIDTYNSLCDDKNSKEEIISEIDKENNSDEFKKCLDEFLANEKKYKEELYLEQQKKEYAERQRKMLKDKEIQEERNRRQKLLEEERSKDIANGTRQLLMEKKKIVGDSISKTKSESKVTVPPSRVSRNSEFGETSKAIVNSSDTVKSSSDVVSNDIKNDIDDTFFSSKEMDDLRSKSSNNDNWF